MNDYGSDWHKVRAEHLKAHPTCALCGATATTVHHVLPISEAPLLRLDSANLTSLCKRCHGLYTAWSKRA